MKFIELQHVDFSWQNKKVLTDIHFSLNSGEFLLVCGANGAGKSTLLQLLAGIYTPTQGEILCNEDLFSFSSLVLQNPDLQILGQNVLEDMLIDKPNPKEEDINKALEYATLFGLSDLIHLPVEDLSYGQKRKLCIVNALLRKPQLLLLDEPSAGLDFSSLKVLKQILWENKKNNLAQCITTHDIEPYLDLAEKVLILHEGKMFFLGSAENAVAIVHGQDEVELSLPVDWKKKEQ